MLNKTEHMDNAGQVGNLLKDAFIELDFNDPKNDSMLEALSKTVMGTAVFQQAASKKTWKDLIGRISLQTIFIVFVVCVGIALSLKLWIKKELQEVQKKENTKRENAVFSTTLTPLSNKEQEENLKENSAVIQWQEHSSNSIPVPVIDTAIILSAADADLPKYTEPVASTTIPVVIPAADDNNKYIFPTLTEKEIRANNRQKKKMGDLLFKLSKMHYQLILHGTVTVKGNVKNLGDFYMLMHEVTNLEYRTFLFDLLIQNKKAEFLKAKPNQALWINCIGDDTFNNLKDVYFSSKVYDGYPVVNISAEGAKMYCEWLNEMQTTRDNQKMEFDVKLPTEDEWRYSARKDSNYPYPWPHDSIQNRYNNFLANFCIVKKKEDLYTEYRYRNKISRTAYTSAGLAMNTDTIATASVYSYNPNYYGLYCMSGNVAEWTISQDGTAKALGGSWGSDYEHLKIDSESEYIGKTKSPFIGFRLLVLTKQKQ